MLKEISFEIIRRCPNNCLHCSSYSTDKCTEIIPVELFKKVVKGAKRLGAQTISFSGGEPFLHPDIVEMIDFVHSLGLNSYIYSSGIVMDQQGNRSSLSENTIYKIAGKVSKIIFNIEAANEKTYDLIMGTKGNFPLMKQSIRDVVRAGITAEGHFVPNELNKDEIRDTLDMCRLLGIDKVSFLRLVIHGRALENRTKLQLTEQSEKSLKQELIQIKKSNKYAIRIGVPILGENSEVHCEAAKGKLNIRYDGKVYPCEVFKNNRANFIEGIAPANIFDDDIEDIYNNSQYLCEVRKLVDSFFCGNCGENCIGQFYINRGEKING